MGQYRFRTGAEGELVLQVYEEAAYSPYEHRRTGTWRDAKVTDIPTAAPFAAGVTGRTVTYNLESGEWGSKP
jgi:hypothetical protein